MKHILVFSFVFSSFIMYAQPAIDWQYSFGGSDNESFSNMIITSDGGYMLCGTTFSDDGDILINHGNRDMLAIKLDEFRNVEWIKTYGGNFDESEAKVVETADGYLFGATTESSTGDVSGYHGGGGDVWLLKTDFAGVIEWQKCLGGNSNDFLKAIEATDDGNFIFSAYSASTNGNIETYYGSEDLWVMKISPEGDSIWEANIGEAGSDQVYGMTLTSDGGCLLVGQTFSNTGIFSENNGYGDLMVVKLDASGNFLWSRCFGGTAHEIALSVIETSDNNYLIAGFTASDDGDITAHQGDEDIWLIKTDVNGNMIWQKTYGGTESDIVSNGYGITEHSPGKYIFSGYSESIDGDIFGNHGGNDGILMKVDADGNLIWEKNYGGSLGDIFSSIHIAPDGGLYLTGSTSSEDGDITLENKGGSDAWFVKTEPEFVNIEDQDAPKLFMIGNSITNNAVMIYSASNISYSIKLYNTSGKLIKSDHATGNTSLNLPIAQGIYLLSFQCGDVVENYKVMRY